ncbi:hypothetical protein J2Z48_001914 [Croceifilum oryzae]|uniref:Uncharacterized protein n=1 Tax=Croceifilum oryzae TaxID=1553429 RepID=A0AAJ1TKF4_9BACL|nr:hypothetical protein [Croceifilum oryzae]MDQ0417741.1 hypothetical protein [Croceifilum oryzae]
MKKLILTLTIAVAVLVTGIGTSLQVFASEVEKKEDILRKGVSPSGTEIAQPTYSAAYEQQDFKPNGWKKTAMVYALKYGGDYIGKLLKILNKEAGDYLKKHSYEIGDALDRFTTQIEQNLIDFMIHTLGFPQWVARNIAWAIMFLIV